MRLTTAQTENTQTFWLRLYRKRYLLSAGGKGELRQMAENRTVLFLHFYFLDITKTICLNCF